MNTRISTMHDYLTESLESLQLDTNAQIYHCIDEWSYVYSHKYDVMVAIRNDNLAWTFANPNWDWQVKALGKYRPAKEIYHLTDGER